ncbi:MAG: LssY C-terminal domain-containing protein [Planctomycetota bacterium]
MSLPKRRLRRWLLLVFLFVVIVWFLLAYVILPALWRHYEHHPAMVRAPKTTETRDGIPGDPLNVGLVGSETEIVNAFLQAHWYPADPKTFRTALHIAASVVRNRSYPDAPVSDLYVWGRRQDLAFEQAKGKSPRQRHHVRFWQSTDLGVGGRPFWIGAATFDRSVGLSHRTGQITHHIAPDVDADRRKLIADLTEAGQLTRVYQVTGVGSRLIGRNGGGDWYYTDGELTIGVIAPQNIPQANPPTVLDDPLSVQMKNKAWSWLYPIMGQMQE